MRPQLAAAQPTRRARARSASSPPAAAPSCAGRLEAHVGRLPIFKLIFMAAPERIVELRPLVERAFQGRASLTTAIPGMLEARWGRGRGVCAFAAQPAWQTRPTYCRALSLSPPPSPPTPSCPPAGAAAGLQQGLRSEPAAGPVRHRPCRLHGAGRWRERRRDVAPLRPGCCGWQCGAARAGGLGCYHIQQRRGRRGASGGAVCASATRPDVMFSVCDLRVRPTLLSCLHCCLLPV